MIRHRAWTRLPAAATVIVAGCNSSQSALAPAGVDAERINLLFQVMTVSGALVFVAVMAFIALALFGNARQRARLANEKLIHVAGVAFPAVVLTALLLYGFVVLRAGTTGAGEGNSFISRNSAPSVAVNGELWWWRVQYTNSDSNSSSVGTTFDSANELHIPVNEPVRLLLTSDNVIHSFWVPSLAGKLDMIPGRRNILTLTATKPGVFRGQCAEYCGGAHAMMSFFVVAHEPSEYAAWRAHEASPAIAPSTNSAQRGAQLFLDNGCGACHAVRGTSATGTIGPDLTHMASRRSLAAATLPNDSASLASWIVRSTHIKPESRMPPYTFFTDTDLADLVSYLMRLR